MKTLLVACALMLVTGSVHADVWGSIEGQFVLDGAIPSVPLLVKKGDAAAKDAAVCAAQDVPDDGMAIDPETKGIGSVIIFMRKAAKIHPDLMKSKEATVEFDQKGCRFFPHAMVVRTDQKVLCKSSDAVAHNVHTNPFANSPANFIVQPNDKSGSPVAMPIAESLPVKVVCDIHPWMIAWWVVADHPYVAITDAQGKFKIENLPEGKMEFRVWHEKAGYIERKWEIDVKADATTTVPLVKVAVSKFE